MAAFGIKAIQPQDNEHIFGFATARGTADMALLEVWNGPTQSDLRFTIDKEGQLQTRDGSAARPTYSFETDKTTGRYLSGSASMLDVVSGTAVGTWTAGKLTLVELQVDNINVNGNTISSTAGTDLLITPLSGQQIVLDGTIIIDAGVVTGATSITSSSFVGTLTGSADSATTATTATNVTSIANDSTNETVYPTFVDAQTGAQQIETDVGLTYNPSTGVLTATTFTGALTGAASTIVVADSSQTTTYPAFFDSATGSLAIKTDASNLTYNASTGVLTSAGIIVPDGKLTLASTDVTSTAAELNILDGVTSTTAELNILDGVTSTTAELNILDGVTSTTAELNILDGVTSTTAELNILDGATVVVGEINYLDLGATAVGTAIASKAVILDSNKDYTGIRNLTATTFIGALTGNAATATTSAHVTVTDNESTSENNLIPFVEDAADSTGSHGLEMDGDFHYNPLTGTVTATAFTGTATVATKATTVVVTDSTDISSYIAMFNAAGDGSTAQSARTDGALKYNAGTGNLESTIITATTSIVPDESDGATLGTASLEFSDLFLADGAQIAFGDDQEVTLTHVADTGLLLSDDSGIGTTQLQFGDSGTYIHQSADGVLDLVADTEIEINATTIDMNGAVDISGAVQAGSTITVGVDDAGHDVKFFGNTASAYMLWDTSSDDLVLAGAAGIDLEGDIDVNGTAHLDVVDIDGAVDMASTALVTGVLTTTATQVATGGITSGSDIISDTDGTDSLGSTGVRWLKGWFDTLTAGTLTIGSGSVTDSSGAISFGNENLTTTGIVTAAGTSVFTNLDISGDVDVDGTTNLDVVDIDGAVDMASTLTVHSNVSITVPDSSATLQLVSTDDEDGAGPLILLDRDTASPAAGDAMGRIYCQGRNSADELITYSQITTKSIDVGDSTEDGEMLFNIMVNGASTTVLDLYGPTTQMNTTTFDLNGALDVSGTSTLTGNVSAGADIIIGATDKLRLDGSASGNTYIRESSADTITFTTEGADNFAFASDSGNPSIQILAPAGGATGTVEYSEGGTFFWQHGVRGYDENWYLTGNATLHSSYALMISGQDVTVGGDIAAASKSFRIDHPLTDMADTHTLTHACIEGPRADLIYRSSVALSGGTASVDLDESAGISDGTWEALCRDPQVYLQNDTGWSALKGSISGSTLIISCENTNSTDTVSWMVVAERDDPTYHASRITDDDGVLILEAEKPEEDE